MSQPPVNVKLALPQKPAFINRPGVVQVLQTGPSIGSQTIIQQRSPSFKSFTTVRPYVPAAGVPVNTNTAIQYVRKQEMTVINSAGGFVASPLAQSFTPYGSPLMTLNPNVIQPLSGHGVPPGSVTGLGTSGPVLSSLANSRKPCNCTKSHCLKLYCECFAQGQLCQNCNCNNCMNNLAYEEERGRAIKMTLERNPTAFHPKIGRGEGERKHTKGCNCKRSGCLKNYCECYEAKISCSDLCRCQGCRNTEDSVERRSLMRLAAMGSLRSRQPASFKKHLVKPPSETLPHVFFTWEVIEATVGCLLAQAEEAERRDLPPAAQERIILEEFGRILEHVIDSASKAQLRSSSSIQGGDSENEHSLLHAPSSQVPVNLAPRSAAAVGSATAAAAAADVLLRDDDDDDDEMMREMGVDDDDDDPGDLDDDLYDDDDVAGPTSAHQLHSQRHTRQSLSQRVPTSHRSGHGHADLLDDDMLSDDDGMSGGRNLAGLMSHKYRQAMGSRSRSSHSMEARYRPHHSRRSTSGGRGHEHHDPDSMI